MRPEASNNRPERLRVLVLHSPYRSGEVSGENQVAAMEARLLRQAGHLVETVMPDPVGDSLRAKFSAAGRAIWSGQALTEIKQIVPRFRPDVAHFHNLVPSISPAAVRLCHRVGIPTAMSLHDYRLMCLPAEFFRDGKVCELCKGKVPWRGVALKCYRDSLAGSAVLGTSLVLHRALSTFDQVDLLLPVSNFVKQKHEEGGISSQRMRVKPNFVAGGKRRSGPGKGFLYAGALALNKGADRLQFLGATQEFDVTVVGSGPLQPRVESMPGIRFLGPVSQGEVQELIADSRAVLVPSRGYETQGRIILEAFSAGVPVIASRIGGIPDAVKAGQNGLLVEAHNPDSWISAMRRLNDESESLRMGRNAFQTWRTKYSPEIGLRDLESCYRETMMRKSRTQASGTSSR